MPTRFSAFLSYSHADGEWARWLLRRLETYRVPARLVGTRGTFGVIGPRLGTFFRDRDELPSSGDLGSTIRAALDESAALIVVCSPAAARSRWVNAEVEAFRLAGRGDRVLCFVVDGDPGNDDPARQCFPPAALAPGQDGKPVEPLAADARREGDGRERAFLKLVAGLLGIGYDALAQREAQRRQRKWAVVAAASLAGMAIALALAATAWIARNDARRRQAQAEDIMGFMLGDLREKLSTVGRLDLMRSVDDKATGYFATLDPRDLSDLSLEQQARSLTGIGEVRLGEGNHDAAMAAFREAHARSTALYHRAPGNGQRLFDLAQAEYWIGFVAFEQGRLDDAGLWFGRYKASALKLAAMDPHNFDWQREVAYGHHNLAVLDERLGRYADAEREMSAKRELYRAWLQQRPRDLKLRYEDANTAAWLGLMSARQGKLEQAERYYVQQARAMESNAREDPGNAEWKEVRIDALILLTDVQAQRGRLAQARTSIGTATPLAFALAGQDPDNNGWQVSPAICRWWQAQLAVSKDAGAQAHAAQATAILTRAHHAEPKNERVLSWLVRARNLQAQLALDRGDLDAATRQLAAARTLIEPAWQASQNEGTRLWLARTRMLEAELAQRQDQRAAATGKWNQARELLQGDAAQGIPFARLDPLVRTLHQLGLDDEAAPHRQRLDAAGYVPLQAFPAATRIAAQ